MAGVDISEYRDLIAPLPPQQEDHRFVTYTPIKPFSPARVSSSSTSNGRVAAPLAQPVTPKSMIITKHPVSYIPKEEPTTIKYIPMYANKPAICEREEIPAEAVKRKYGSKGEQICCEVLEKIYGVPFNSRWPAWLKNPETGANLEIDCYNDDLHLGAEYNGEQHYIYPNHFHRTKDEFIGQVRRDQYKLETCDRNGVYLITVPYNVSHNKIEEYIRYHLPESVNQREICDV